MNTNRFDSFNDTDESSCVYKKQSLLVVTEPVQVSFFRFQFLISFWQRSDFNNHNIRMEFGETG